MKTTSYSLYSRFASALLNNDRSGFEESDEKEFDFICSELTSEIGPNWNCIEVSEDSSFSRPRLALNRNIWGDCADFIFTY